MSLGSLLNASGPLPSMAGITSSSTSSQTYHPSPEPAQMLWGEEEPQLVRHRRRLVMKPNKTPEDIKTLWAMLPPLRDQYGNLYYEDSNPMQYSLLSPEEKKKMDEHTCLHHRGVLLRIPELQGPPPSPYQHLADIWKPEKCKESYPAQGSKRRCSHQD